jgi:GTP-binding protein Era
MAFKAGFISIIGIPNAGKSTLLNRILDFRLSIISPKPQTTRRNIIGILNVVGAQIVFSDTPGILNPSYLLQEKMIKSIRLAIKDADGLVFVLDGASGNKNDTLFKEQVTQFLEINKSEMPVIGVINKIDLIKKESLLPVIQSLSDAYPFHAIVPVSALTGDGVDLLSNTILEIIPEHPPFYDRELITDRPERFLAAELIREQIFLHFNQEIPYGTEVQIETFKEREQGKDYIQAVIYIERASQKAILIGQKGAALKKIGKQARREIERLLGRKIYLDLYVKVGENWRKKEQFLNKFGY